MTVGVRWTATAMATGAARSWIAGASWCGRTASPAAEISRAIVQLMARTAGRGPTKARTTIDGGHALVVVEDALTTERARARRGRRVRAGAPAARRAAGADPRRGDRGGRDGDGPQRPPAAERHRTRRRAWRSSSSCSSRTRTGAPGREHPPAARAGRTYARGEARWPGGAPIRMLVRTMSRAHLRTVAVPRSAAPPLIGVVTHELLADGTPGWAMAPGRSERDLAPQRLSMRLTYTQALQEAGAIAVVLPAHGYVDDTGALLDRLDGLLVSGGPDLDPAVYGQEPPPGARPAGRPRLRRVRAGAARRRRRARPAAARHLPRAAGAQRLARRDAAPAPPRPQRARPPPAPRGLRPGPRRRRRRPGRSCTG